MIALETMYRGVVFRSRLEARWAVFFDWMYIRWEYEKEGVDLHVGRTLPHEINESFDTTSRHKNWASGSCSSAELRHRLPTQALRFMPSGTQDEGYCWTECSQCGQLGIDRPGCRPSGAMRCKCYPAYPVPYHYSTRLVIAYEAARGERFDT